MMMAHDSTSNDPKLSSAALAALETALKAYLANESATATLEPALRQLAAEARDKKMHAEQLLVVLKDIWFALPQVATAPPGAQQNRLLQRVVTLCIRAYYSA